MKKETLFIIAIIILLAFNSVLLYKHKQLKNNHLSLFSQLSELLGKEDFLKTTSIVQHFSEGMPANGIEVRNSENGMNVPLSSLAENDACLFFRFKETDCDGCVQQSIRLLEKFSNQFPEMKIFILSGYSNVRYFHAYVQNHKENFIVYNLNFMPLTADNQDEPYFFVLTPDQRIQNVFITNNEDNSFSEEYIDCMRVKYWSAHIHDHNCEHEHCDHHH